MQTMNQLCIQESPLSKFNLLPSHLRRQLQAFFAQRRLEYIANVLTPEELRIISDLRDAVIIARIKRMPDWKLKRFDRLVPHDDEGHKHYQAVQSEWLRGEQYLLGTRLGRSPTHRELFVDFMNNHNGQRFRAYFALKYPDRMRLRTPSKCSDSRACQ